MTELAVMVELHERLAGGGLADRVELAFNDAVDIFYGDGDGDGGKVCSIEIDDEGLFRIVTSYDGGNVAHAYLLVDPMTGKAFGADGRPVIAASLYYAVRSLVETLDALDAVDLDGLALMIFRRS
jgi:hypothetical protein